MFGIKAFTPWWFAEGGAQFSQSASIFANSFPKYASDRKFWTKGLFGE